MTSCHTSKWIIAQNLEHFRKLSFIFHLRFKIIFIAYMHSHSTFKVHQVELETLILKESHSLFFPHYPTILQLQLQHPPLFWQLAVSSVGWLVLPGPRCTVAWPPPSMSKTFIQGLLMRNSWSHALKWKLKWKWPFNDTFAGQCIDYLYIIYILLYHIFDFQV